MGRIEKRLGSAITGKRSVVAAVVLGAAVSGCVTASEGPAGPAEYGLPPSEDSARSGLQHFDRGEYGLAARDFEQRVLSKPSDASAWVALAASYDRIGRFDLSDRAYLQASALAGETAQILNNEGFSYMLRGQLNKARAKLEAARKLDPKDPLIENNLKLLDASQKLLRHGDGT